MENENEVLEEEENEITALKNEYEKKIAEYEAKLKAEQDAHARDLKDVLNGNGATDNEELAKKIADKINKKRG